MVPLHHLCHIARGTEALEEMYIHMYSHRIPAARCSQIMWLLILAHSAFDYNKDTVPSQHCTTNTCV